MLGLTAGKVARMIDSTTRVCGSSSHAERSLTTQMLKCKFMQVFSETLYAQECAETWNI